MIMLMENKVKNLLNGSCFVGRANLIIRILRWLIFISLGLLIASEITAMIVLSVVEYAPSWLETILLWSMAIPGYTLIYSAKVFLIVVPIIGLIQYVYNRKDKAVNSYFISNFVLWIAVALVTIWINYSQNEEAKCMEQCVNADKSNYAECALDTCDFPL